MAKRKAIRMWSYKYEVRYEFLYPEIKMWGVQCDRLNAQNKKEAQKEFEEWKERRRGDPRFRNAELILIQ